MELKFSKEEILQSAEMLAFLKEIEEVSKCQFRHFGGVLEISVNASGGSRSRLTITIDPVSSDRVSHGPLDEAKIEIEALAQHHAYQFLKGAIELVKNRMPLKIG